MEAERAKSGAAQAEAGGIVPLLPPAPSQLSAEEQALHAAQAAAIEETKKRKGDVQW
jgi:hypothetical protein